MYFFDADRVLSMKLLTSHTTLNKNAVHS